MSWNYRVIHRGYVHYDEAPEQTYAIHEVYYDDEGRPNGVTESPDGPHGETLEELKADVQLMLRAFDESILEWTDIVKEDM